MSKYLKLTDTEMIEQAESVKQLLIDCMNNPGADIQIAVTQENGQTATANLYDQAALVQMLVESLDEFISEIS